MRRRGVAVLLAFGMAACGSAAEETTTTAPPTTTTTTTLPPTTTTTTSTTSTTTVPALPPLSIEDIEIVLLEVDEDCEFEDGCLRAIDPDIWIKRGFSGDYTLTFLIEGVTGGSVEQVAEIDTRGAAELHLFVGVDSADSELTVTPTLLTPRPGRIEGLPPIVPDGLDEVNELCRVATQEGIATVMEVLDEADRGQIAGDAVFTLNEVGFRVGIRCGEDVATAYRSVLRALQEFYDRLGAVGRNEVNVGIFSICVGHFEERFVLPECEEL